MTKRAPKEAAWIDVTLSNRLPHLCEGGETQKVEFKRELPKHADELAKTVAAFSTSNAGIILLGVADSGDMVGMSELASAKFRDEFGRRVSGICQNSVRPRPAIRIAYAKCDGKLFAAVSVNKGHQPLYWANERSYMRDGASSRPMDPVEVIQAVKRWLSRHEPPSTPRSSVVRQRSDRKTLVELLSRFDTAAIDEFVERLKSDYMTWSGVLYYEAVVELLISPSFRLHNRKLDKAVRDLHAAWEQVMRHVADFRDTSFESVQRFVKPREVGSYPAWEKLHKAFRRRASAFERAYVALLNLVHKQHPDIDLRKTSRRARAIRAYVERR